jgi:hypothetical protein
MFQASADESGRILTMSYSHHVAADEMRSSLETVRNLLPQLHAGFLLLTDLSSLDSMEMDCAPYMAEIMDLCNAKEMKTAVRVVPDPTKDIGYSVISLFHDNPKVDTRTFDNLASAIESLTPSA